MNKFKLQIPRIKLITNIIIALSGLFLLVFPETSLVTVCSILGISILIKGIGKILGGSVLSGVSSVVLAIILFLHPKILISVFPFIIGLIVLGYAIYSLRKNTSTSSKILNVLMLIGGVVIIIAPLGFATALTSIIGAVLLVIGLILIFSQLTEKKNKQITKEIIDTEIIDVEDSAEIIEVNDFKDVD